MNPAYVPVVLLRTYDLVASKHSQLNILLSSFCSFYDRRALSLIQDSDTRTRFLFFKPQRFRVATPAKVLGSTEK